MMGRIKTEKYALVRIDQDLESMIKEIQNGMSFREASKIFAINYKNMKWENEARKKIFTAFLCSITIWGLSYLTTITVI